MVLFGGGGGGEHKKISMLFSKVVNGPSPAELKLRDKNVSGYQLGSITWAAFQGKVFIFISQNEGGSKDHNWESIGNRKNSNSVLHWSHQLFKGTWNIIF